MIISLPLKWMADHRQQRDTDYVADWYRSFVCAFGMLLMLLPVVGCNSTIDPQLLGKFQAAQTTFDRAQSPEDYLRAASLFQEIQNAGVINGALLYNLGNAYLRAEQRGRAIAFYRQALRYRPRDPYVQANLQFALGTGTLLQERHKILDYLLFWQDWIGYRTKFQLTATFSSFAFLAGLAGQFLPARRFFYGLAWSVLLVAMVLALSAGYDWYRFEWLEQGVIVSNAIEARKGNSENYAPAFSQPLAEGTEFRLLERRGQWWRIQIEGIGEGWVEGKWAVAY